MSQKSIYSTEHRKISKKLKHARLQAGLTQLEVADELNKSQSYISKAETGLIRLDIVQLKQFSELYEKNIDYFLKGLSV